VASGARTYWFLPKLMDRICELQESNSEPPQLHDS
jgi:hypothetical protein